MSFEEINIPEGLSEHIYVDPDTCEVMLPPEMEDAIERAFSSDPEVLRRRSQVELGSAARNLGKDAVTGALDEIASMGSGQSETPPHPRYSQRYGVSEDEA